MQSQWSKHPFSPNPHDISPDMFTLQTRVIDQNFKTADAVVGLHVAGFPGTCLAFFFDPRQENTRYPKTKERWISKIFVELSSASEDFITSTACVNGGPRRKQKLEPSQVSISAKQASYLVILSIYTASGLWRIREATRAACQHFVYEHSSHQ